MPDFGLELHGELKVALRFREFPQLAHDRLLAALQNIEQRMAAAVLADEPEKTGELRSLTGGRVYDDETKISARVGVRTEDGNQARKAAALEYGSHKALTVRAHTARLAHIWARAIAQIQVNIPAYTRTPDLTARRFLRGGLDAVYGDAITDLRAAIDAAVEDSNA